MAPERAKRPQNGPKGVLVDELPVWKESCPFCPGNESKTPEEVFRLPQLDSASVWAVRVVPNLLATLEPAQSGEDICRLDWPLTEGRQVINGGSRLFLWL